MKSLSRRNWITTLLAAGAMTHAIEAQEPTDKTKSDLADLYVGDQLDAACSRAVDFLLSKQDSRTGQITDRGHSVTLTSLSIMAMASMGIQPTEKSLRGRAMQKALTHVLSPNFQTDSGYFGKRDGSRMYGHGITTLMLTEMLGMGVSPEQNAVMHDRLGKAIRLILSSQAVPKPKMLQGGWRYEPGSNESDLSVSVWQLMALRSAKNDDLEVPSEAIEQALEYLRNSFTGRRRGAKLESGGFSYYPNRGGPTFTMTAAGLLAMQVCGQYDAPEVKAAADWLLARRPATDDNYLFYGLYYYAQGMYQYGGKHSQEAQSVVSDMLLPTQRRDGSWMSPSQDERNIGLVYSTCMALLSLSVRFHYLPIYQR